VQVFYAGHHNIRIKLGTEVAKRLGNVCATQLC